MAQLMERSELEKKASSWGILDIGSKSDAMLADCIKNAMSLQLLYENSPRDLNACSLQEEFTFKHPDFIEMRSKGVTEKAMKTLLAANITKIEQLHHLTLVELQGMDLGVGMANYIFSKYSKVGATAFEDDEANLATDPPTLKSVADKIEAAIKILDGRFDSVKNLPDHRDMIESIINVLVANADDEIKSYALLSTLPSNYPIRRFPNISDWDEFKESVLKHLVSQYQSNRNRSRNIKNLANR